MPVLWLKAHGLMTGDIAMDTDLKARVLSTLRGVASWQGSPHTVEWVGERSLQTIPDTDCIVYIVRSWQHGAAREMLNREGAQVTAQIRNVVSMDNTTELGCAIPLGDLYCAEVHMNKIKRRMLGLRAAFGQFQASHLPDLAIAISVVVWHEAMHVKVEPALMEGNAGWDQHTSGGNWAGNISFSPSGSYIGPRRPDTTSSRLMQQHMGRAVDQFRL